ncbi:alpha-mannosidase [Aureibacillus halotolerans]|uniref:Alpha-mannosidase n=1 Tax=Aureibacillus halotolerans TaxID=1508390 RepID=A0A4R6TQD4_9BACI|nr:alpha-mannosidase [Aureibacillus halotolerans]TDQ34112.1 alpha-mannosidase [Aureibacillus halotolerans]
MKKTAHLISHTHWDREWYMPYEYHHMRLIDVMDSLLETLDKGKGYESFHLDGQTIMLEDYFQVRPEKREHVTQYINAGRIHIGPWYILQDEFLTSSEANLRNLQIGHQDANAYGKISKLGYFPDSFGNMGQAPQILKQAGIDTAAFGRGVKPTGFNNTVSDGNFESPYSEMMWEAPDGSQVLGILFANWYSNGNEVPTSEEEAKVYWEEKLKSAERFASTSHLLYMNGCDHQPIQTDLPEAIETANALLPDLDVVHSDFDRYIEAMKAELPDDLTTIKGELRSQQTDGWYTLVNTASARVYLKQMNQHAQTLLEKSAEPFAVMASSVGYDYPQHKFTYAWKTLMQNHPHDSICGCSVDEVHREMVTRFDKATHVAETIVQESLSALASHTDTSSFNSFDHSLPFIVANGSGDEASGIVTVKLEAATWPFANGGPGKSVNEMKAYTLPTFSLVDSEGNTVEATIIDLGAHFDYDLPTDRFRQPYIARHVEVTFEAEAVPAFGTKAFSLVAAEKTEASKATLLSASNTLENDYVRGVVEEDGSLTLTDKVTGNVYKDLGVYENSGDLGNEYIYKQPEGETPLTTKGVQASVSVVEDTPYRAVIEAVHAFEIPVKANETLDVEIQELVEFRHRKAQRVEDKVTLAIHTQYILEKNGKGVRIRSSFDNTAQDHRLRMLFPTDIETDEHFADSIFEVAKRSNVPEKEWENPSNCQHQQAFCAVLKEERGLTVANKGLNEYEILQDGRNTLAVTLIRSVRELGDWGVFLTPEAQCQGAHSTDIMVIPHTEATATAAYGAAYQFQSSLFTAQIRTTVSATLPAVTSPLSWEGHGLLPTSLKQAENGDWMVRWYNPTSEQITLTTSVEGRALYVSNVLEERTEETNKERLSKVVKPYEIVTFGSNSLR